MGGISCQAPAAPHSARHSSDCLPSASRAGLRHRARPDVAPVQAGTRGPRRRESHGAFNVHQGGWISAAGGTRLEWRPPRSRRAFLADCFECEALSPCEGRGAGRRRRTGREGGRRHTAFLRSPLLLPPSLPRPAPPPTSWPVTTRARFAERRLPDRVPAGAAVESRAAAVGVRLASEDSAEEALAPGGCRWCR